jgi:hypothetical protein
MDRGDERAERETRLKMKRKPYGAGDFHSLEERHILFGDVGTPQDPVLVETIYASRIVGCTGTEKLCCTVRLTSV